MKSYGKMKKKYCFGWTDILHVCFLFKQIWKKKEMCAKNKNIPIECIIRVTLIEGPSVA